MDSDQALLVLTTVADEASADRIAPTRGAYPALSEEVERLHDYELPELLAVPVDSGSAAYLGWLAAAVNTKEQV